MNIPLRFGLIVIAVCFFIFPVYAQTEASDVIQKLTAEFDALQKLLDGQKKALEDQHTEYEKKIVAYRESLATKNTEINFKNVLLNQKDQLLTEKDKLIQEKQEIINNVKLSKDQKEKLLAEKEAQIAEKIGSIESLKKDIDAKDQLTKSLGSNIQDLRVNIESQKQLIDSKQSEIGVTKSLVEAKENKIEEYKKDIDKLTNKRKWYKIIQGVGFYQFRTPKYELSPKSAQEFNTYVIVDKNSGKWEGDFFNGFGILMYDFDSEDKEQKFSVGPLIGFGGNDLFANFYVGATLKVYMIFFHAGFNFHKFELLQNGFGLGDVMAVGQTIPKTEEWKVFVPYVGISIDTEYLVNVVNSSKK